MKRMKILFCVLYLTALFLAPSSLPVLLPHFSIVMSCHCWFWNLKAVFYMAHVLAVTEIVLIWLRFLNWPSFVQFVFIELMLWWVVGGSSLSLSTQEQFTWRSTVMPNRKTGIIYGSYSQLYPSLNHGQHSIQLHVQKHNMQLLRRIHNFILFSSRQL